MDEAIREAAAAGARGEVPIGAVVVLGEHALAQAGNASVAERDPTAHAEVRALRAAAHAAGNHRLSKTTLYVTVEPCVGSEERRVGKERRSGRAPGTEKTKEPSGEMSQASK